MSTQQQRVYNGRYELNRHIARGGMAEVYLAHDLLLDRPVALKVLFPELSVDRSFVERFRREAQAAANLSHQNIVSIFDWGEEDGTYFIVMEYVSGQPLSHFIRTEAKLPADRAAQIAAGTAAALSNAHRNGVVHRDIKPGNILLDDQGQVKVTDFGIARAGDPKENLTQTGVVMGTATYFSPEQAQGLPTDQRTDVYSLGVVLYEMVTGRPPFSGETPVAIAYKHVKEEPVPPREVEPTVPEDFEAIVLAAMEKDREDRYPTADELRADLIRFARGQTPKAVRVRRALAAPAAAVLGPADATMAVAPSAGPDPTVAIPATGGVARTVRPDRPGPPPVFADHDERKPRTGLFMGLSVGLLVLLLLLLFLLARLLGFGGAGSSATRVEVDNVVNRTFDDASRLLRAKGFEVTREDRPDAGAPSGTVVDQNPQGGSQAPKGSEVRLFVALASGKVEVPSVVDLKQAEAEAMLKEVGLEPRVELVKNSSVTEGFVFEQDPAPKTPVDDGSRVTLRVSSGEGLPAVPDVTNLPVLEATNRLTAAGFRTRTVEENSPNVAAGNVTRTDPPANSKLGRGENTVTLFVSRGAPTTTVGRVSVPNVVGQNEAGARAALNAVGLNVQVQSSPGGTPGRVKAQNPGDGARVDAGSTVTITLGTASTTLTAPPTSPTTNPSTSTSTRP
ncbi:MAG: Serine/threonine protein kinase PrkC, regulator of stationary phase [uncultured Acidimicrobiales bacterium]|uniref:non-specific serine/threonine protein kinase n=1 Tax=uncultured Acidimicrobiales bacterium TaxID=310071 RepID=A0A6J4IFY9_9ACTN|nr:MAG: Serine/threonine protein kinase PrkC, regulator of stationary phase [uncultured Acidimicrobiales bacterium]